MACAYRLGALFKVGGEQTHINGRCRRNGGRRPFVQRKGYGRAVQNGEQKRAQLRGVKVARFLWQDERRVETAVFIEVADIYSSRTTVEPFAAKDHPAAVAAELVRCSRPTSV